MVLLYIRATIVLHAKMTRFPHEGHNCTLGDPGLGEDTPSCSARGLACTRRWTGSMTAHPAGACRFRQLH